MKMYSIIIRQTQTIKISVMKEILQDKVTALSLTVVIHQTAKTIAMDLAITTMDWKEVV